ncbi:hypothetical protein MTER_34450 [Mycolicibacter terrae]|uniref:Uncharacterized protein n=1 Tax=Mycolicibacter terrae TaxID=1788 RepID=A0AAD1I040_9MYCO|nr:hypothetical protein [Mycolicibacter terrae]ORW96064.1 hypothetical protein AWC28_11075 [Mycolicibacter terrae]BBX24034.1 hypothetical protein MTER_34450 [Mycolicibacter terrae]SNV57115.1 Uncharacterised protein [Mycolicibacter terrae]
MADATTFRLDTADIALDSGWHVESTRRTDEFAKGGTSIAVQYSDDDEITSLVRQCPDRDEEFFSEDSPGKSDRLRAWLTGRVVAVGDSAPRPSRYAAGYGPKPRKLSWTKGKWLHRPTLEVVDDSDPRTPRTVDESKRQRNTWHLVLDEAVIEQGYYRREMDMSTAADPEPTIVATWNPNNGRAVTIIRAHGGVAYQACVRHFQENFRDL